MRLPLASVVFVALLGATPFLGQPAQSADEDTSGLDYDFYKARVAPIVQRICGDCHADPRKRLGKHFLRPAKGRRIRERHHEANFKTIAQFIEAGNPAASPWLLKPIGPTQGGVTHEGGIQIRANTPEYGTMVDFINGMKLPPPTFVAPESVEGQPDFRFYVHRIEPVLQRVCAECHEGRGKGRFKILSRTEALSPAEQLANFHAVLKLLKVGDPDKSRFLQKPLAQADGGFKHKGGDRIRKDDKNYVNWVAFIRGERGPPLSSEVEETRTVLTTAGLTIQAEDCQQDGDVRIVEDETAKAFHRVVAGPKGGTLTVELTVQEAADYSIGFHVRTDGSSFTMRLNDGPPSTIDVATHEGEPAYAVVGPRHLVEGHRPLIGATGDIALAAEGVALDGRRERAAFLVNPGISHTGAAAFFLLPHEEDGGDDALLLFDMLDTDNGKFVALTDGGRRFVMGLLERGRRRILAATKAPTARHDGPRQVSVLTTGGVAIGHLDGRPLAFLNLGNRLGKGLFGVATRGRVELTHLAALEEYEVYGCRFDVAPNVHLPRGRVRLQIQLPAGAASLDQIELGPAKGP